MPRIAELSAYANTVINTKVDKYENNVRSEMVSTPFYETFSLAILAFGKIIRWLPI